MQAKNANQSEIYGQDSAICGALDDTGNWKLEIRNWKLETGNWKLETGNSGSQFPVSSFCFMALIRKRGTGKSESRNQKLENKAASFQFPVFPSRRWFLRAGRTTWLDFAVGPPDT
ncbi:MAG: hypothetical protein ABSF73_02840 [Terriglobia bacterium]